LLLGTPQTILGLDPGLMKIRLLLLISLLGGGIALRSSAAIITVTTTNNASPGPGQLSLLEALSNLHDGDEIRFNLPGPGPHYIQTPATGYPYITNNNVTINGYSQPGASPNSNPILAPNTAKIDVVLDSRTGGYTAMGFPLTSPNDDPGFTASDGALLGVVDAQNFHVQGVSFLGEPMVGDNADIALSFLAFGRGASGQISGCWLGVDPDGKTVAGASDGITALRYLGKDVNGSVTNTVLVDNLIVGVTAKATNAVTQFNVLVGMPVTPIEVEGNNTRISGNFVTVLPDGLHDVDVALDPNLQGQFAGAVAIGQAGDNTLIGTDGDGSNDENERNVFGGMLPSSMGGYDHLIEFYGSNPGTNVVIAGNYIGIGIDGKTQFTNGVPVLNAGGPSAQYRIGSNFDNLSDPTEANLIANNYPSSLFPASSFAAMADTLSFLDQLTTTTVVSLRGNSLINNFPFPVSPMRNNGQFLLDYYAQALVDPTQGVSPTLSTNSTATHLIGTVPIADTNTYPATVVDVYIADPVGLTNGAAAGISALPQGFVQGLKYLGSFVENSAADKNPQRGAFDFDLSKFTAPAGSPITVTANYVAPVGFFLPADFSSITKTDSGITITWTGNATLQSAPSLDGPWNDELSADSNSFQDPGADPVKFFRLQAAGSGGAGGNAPTLTSPFSNAVQLH
jgi:hypothetical protein